MFIEKTFAALSDSNRLKMVMLLGTKPLTVDEIRKELKISQSSTSQHLKKLSTAGLVSSSKHGNFRIYSLRQDNLKIAMQFFDHLWDDSLAKLKQEIRRRP